LKLNSKNKQCTNKYKTSHFAWKSQRNHCCQCKCSTNSAKCYFSM